MYKAQQPQQKLPLPNHGSTTAVEVSYQVTSSDAMDGAKEKSGVNSSNLVRHSSKPAGVFFHLNVENGNPLSLHDLLKLEFYALIR